MDVKELFDREFYERYHQKGGIYVIPLEVFQVLLIDQEELIEENAELKKKYENAIADYETAMAEKEQLKKQLEEINKMIEKCGFVNIEQVMLNYCGLLTQQKEFIKYLEDNWKQTQDIWYIKILQKYKSIIGDDK